MINKQVHERDLLFLHGQIYVCHLIFVFNEGHHPTAKYAKQYLSKPIHPHGGDRGLRSLDPTVTVW